MLVLGDPPPPLSPCPLKPAGEIPFQRNSRKQCSRRHVTNTAPKTKQSVLLSSPLAAGVGFNFPRRAPGLSRTSPHAPFPGGDPLAHQLLAVGAEGGAGGSAALPAAVTDALLAAARLAKPVLRGQESLAQSESSQRTATHPGRHGGGQASSRAPPEVLLLGGERKRGCPHWLPEASFGARRGGGTREAFGCSWAVRRSVSRSLRALGSWRAGPAPPPSEEK